MTTTARRQRRSAASADVVHLLDGNLLYASIDEAHVHHASARTWFAAMPGPFATCPITQGTMLRLLMCLGEPRIERALDILAAVTAHAKHRFWPDVLPYAKVRWVDVMGHRQVTDAYLTSLARHQRGKLATFDRGLVALHPDVAVAVE